MAPNRKNKGRTPSKSRRNRSKSTNISPCGNHSNQTYSTPAQGTDQGSSQHRSQDPNFVSPSLIAPSKKKSSLSSSIIRTRRQTLHQQQQQQQEIQEQKLIEDSFDPPSSSLSMQSMQKENQERDLHNNPISGGKARGSANPVSASSSLSMQRQDPWNDSRFSSNRQSDQRFHSGYPGSGHMESSSNDRFLHYSDSVTMSNSPTHLNFGYDPPRDMRPPIAAELELAAKEDDDALNLDGGFPEPSSSSRSHGQPQSTTKNISGGGSKQSLSGSSSRDRSVKNNSGKNNEQDDFHRGGSQEQSNRGYGSHGNAHPQNSMPYQNYPNHGGNNPNYSHHPHGMSSGSMKGTQGNYPNMHSQPPSYNHHIYTPSHSQIQGGHGYFPSPHYEGPNHSGYQRNPQGDPHTSYSRTGNQTSYSPYVSHSARQDHQGTWSPERKRQPYGSDENVHDNSRMNPNDKNNSQPHSTSGRQPGNKHESPPWNKRPIHQVRNDGWGNGNDSAENTTPEKLDSQDISKSDSNLLGIGVSPFRSPDDKDHNGRLKSKRQKSSPLFTGVDTPSSSYHNFPLFTTPGSHIESQLNFSPMGHSISNTFMPDDPVAGNRPDREHSIHSSSNPFGDMGNTPGNQNSYHNTRGRRPASPPVHCDSRNLHPRSPFSNFITQLSPLPNVNSGLQSSPMDRGEHHTQHDSNRQNMFTHKHGTDYNMTNRGKSIDMGYGMDRHAGGGYKNSSTEMRNRSPSYDSNSARERFRQNTSGPIRLQIGNLGLKQTETRKGLDGINHVVRGPPLAQRNRSAGMHGSPPPMFPFGGSDSSRNPAIHGDHRRMMISDRPDHDEYSPPLANISNRSSVRGAPVSNVGPHYGTYHGGMGMMAAPPRYFGMPLQGTTPIKSAPGKENDKKGEKRAPCNCKRSRCLKLYCECFAAEKYCVGCNCHDCNNTPAFETIRNEAIKATRAKNPNAFKPRFASKFRPGIVAASPVTGHNMGCRCKKSACLKKYCECFEAGAVCGDKCKCVDCQNFIGSQALIDRRRKIKDHRGAEYAMRTADQAWKSRGAEKKISGESSQNPLLSSHHSSSSRSAIGMSPSPMHRHGAHTPGSVRSGNSQSFMPPQDSTRPHSLTHGKSSKDEMNLSFTRTPLKSHTKTPRTRIGFDPHSKKKLNKSGHSESYPVFGPKNPEQSKSIALAVFSYLANDDLFNASLVSKLWSKLSLDEELWQF